MKQKNLRQKHFKKRAGSLLLAAAMAITSIPAFGAGVHAAEGADESLQFVTKDQLMAYNTDDTDGSTDSARLYFGNNGKSKQAWLIAGRQNQDADSVTLFANSPLKTDQPFNPDYKSSDTSTQTKSYDSGWGCTYETAPSEVNANHYGASPLRTTLKELETSYFSTAEQALMKETTIYTDDTKNSSVYSTTDKLYLAYEGSSSERYITVGANSKDSLNDGLHIGLNYFSTGYEFWLRAPDYDAYKAKKVSKGQSNYVSSSEVDRKSEIGLWAAFELDLSSVLFASAAEASSSDKVETKGTGTDAWKTLRLDGASKAIGTVAYYKTSDQLVAQKDANATGSVYLVVQGKGKSGTEWYCSMPVEASRVVTQEWFTYQISNGILSTGEKIDFEKCKIWLETTEDNLTYATMLDEKNVFEEITVEPGAEGSRLDVTVRNGSDGTVTIGKGNDGTVDMTVKLPQPGAIIIAEDGTIAVPAGGTVRPAGCEKEMALPNGGTVDVDGNAEAGKITFGDIAVTAPDGEKVTTDKDGTITVPAGGEVQTGDGEIITLPNGGTVDTDGNVVRGEPEFCGFAAKERLKALNTDDTDAGGNADAAKLCFGTNNQEWWIAGSQNKDEDSVTLFAASSLETGQKFDPDYDRDQGETYEKEYKSDWGCAYGTVPDKVAANHYGASPLRTMLEDLETSYFLPAEQDLMKETTVYTDDTKNDGVYSTTDKLYLAYGVIDSNTLYFTVGKNAEDDLNNGLRVDIGYWRAVAGGSDQDERFWLRTPSVSHSSSVPYHDYVSTAMPYAAGITGYMVSWQCKLRPAFELDLSPVLFASAAKAASSQQAESGTIQTQTWNKAAMALRLDGDGKNIGTATYDNETGGIEARKDAAAEGTVSLVVQGNDRSKDWYYSVPVDGTAVVTKEQIKEACADISGDIHFADCRIWLETTTEDQMAYAKMAQAGKVSVSWDITLNPGEEVERGGAAISNNTNGTVTIDKGKDGTVDVTVNLPQAESVEVSADGKITVPAGGTVQAGDGEDLTLPDGGTVDTDGNVEAGKIIRGDTTVTAPDGEKVTADKDGTITVPAGGTVQTGEGEEVTLPNGGTVDKDSGKITLKPGEEAAREDAAISNNTNGTVTIDKGKDGTVDVTVNLPQAESVEVSADGKITVPAGGTVQAGEGQEMTLPDGGTVDTDGNVEAGKIIRGDTTVTAPDGEIVTADKDGKITVPAGGKVQTGEGEEITLPNGGTVDADGNIENADSPEEYFEGKGTGKKEDPYQISAKEDLEKLCDFVNGGEDFSGVFFKVTEDIDLGGGEENPWTPIGTENDPFKGTLDGDRHTVSGLYINDGTKDNQGLFGFNGGTIENLTAEGSVIGKDNVGGIAGTNQEGGIIKDCVSGVDVEGHDNVGGIVGKNAGTVSGCGNTGNVSGNDNVGGIAGTNAGTVSGSDNAGSVSGNDNVGGIAGTNTGSGSVENSENNGDVTGNGTGAGAGTGGVAGKNDGSLKNDTNKGSVTGKNDAGGIAGTNGEDGTVEGCANSGNVTGNGDGATGAVIGSNQNEDSDAVKDDYYQKTDEINKDLGGIGEGIGSGEDPEGITSGQTPEKYDENQAAADEVKGKIDAIPNPVKADQNSKTKIEDARKAYDGLTPLQKGMVPAAYLQKLEKAEQDYANRVNEADKAAAQNVVNKINAIGTVVKTDACAAKIKAARTAYNALTKTQKGMVPASVLKKLTDAEKAYASLSNSPGLTAEEQQKINNISLKLGVSKKTAEKIQAVADELGVSVETLLLTDGSFENSDTEDDITGSAYAMLRLKVTKIANKQVTLKWKKVKAADGYQIYGTRCGKGNKAKLIKTIEKQSKTGFTVKKLLKGKPYRYFVRAYKVIDGKKITIAVSKTAHIFTNGGKYGNAKSVKVNKTKVRIKKGKKFKIKAKEVKASKPLNRHRAICYESSNPKVAAVTKKGVIKGKSKGTCTIYAYAQNGVFKKIKVTVK